MTEPTDVACDIMARLKRDTASLHGEVDAMVAPMLSERARYEMLLAGLRDAYAVIQRELARHSGELARADYDLIQRGKLGRLNRQRVDLHSHAACIEDDGVRTMRLLRRRLHQCLTTQSGSPGSRTSSSRVTKSS